jgi:homospermidine synthase
MILRSALGAERDTQRSHTPKSRGKFINTWSVEGFIAEGLQPSELGWGRHIGQMTKIPRASAHTLQKPNKSFPV